MAPGIDALQLASKDIPLSVPKQKVTSDESIHVELEDADRLDRVLKVFRCLIADLCEQFKGGHPGGAMGMAGIGISLWKYIMRYSPSNPLYFNRDRFVLSNGKC